MGVNLHFTDQASPGVDTTRADDSLISQVRTLAGLKLI